ncbi:ZZ-type zinc finger-containing protein 3 [Cydia pomonella]|uniref:ZZ-type zinc finger-containing protein 3 n=1 Tax=Cydia pomonella TaxID=82600 RepID=UPI002ADD6906|nr:ZZ-type zinc finger-containing protein 3 [Cydia pomonella]XP_061715906.1 ZZ-type zinc finger-containing protein 3 [Cydia pomonella]
MDGIEDPESNGEFAFETDHLALRGNKDYNDLLKYIVVLESQRVAALKDIEELTEARNKALEEPFEFVQKLQAGTIQFPPRHHIREIPTIDWDQYGVDNAQDTDEFNKDIKPDISEVGVKVRGRKYTDSKPETFNQLWSCEEQKRLEELLEVYPEEPIEARRYKKIAKALRTRTPIQVMSRVQKYFAKLAKAGLPIPGRTPKGMGRDKCKSILYKKSNFFPQLHVPVKMEDTYDVAEAPYTATTATATETKVGNKHIVELLRAAKLQRALDETAPVYQKNTLCVGCQAKGFLGARWTDNAGTDYCTDCVVKHLPTEKLTPVRIPLDSTPEKYRQALNNKWC